MLLSLHSRVCGLTGWRRNALAFSCGVLATLTLPPVFFLPLLIPAFGILYWLMDDAPSAKRAFADGWWWGIGWHMSGLYWFCIALLTEPEKFAWLIPFALFGLNAVIALYAGACCWLWKKIGCRGLTGIFLFSVLWTWTEFARGHLFTGFPWNLAGYSFAASDALLQSASLVGAYGLTWFAVFFGAMPAALADAQVKKRNAVIAVSLACAALLTASFWGNWRLQAAGDIRTVPGVTLRLVQANIQQHHKWDEKLRSRGIDEHLRLTQSPGLDRVTAVIWPETAVPYAFNDSASESGMSLAQLLGAALPRGAHLITGGLRVEGSETDWRMYNSILAIDSRGRIDGRYDKVRLVPFGEFLPFRALLPKAWLTPVGEKDFSRGPGPQRLEWAKLPPVAPLICYEAIYPEFTASLPDRPAWFLNLTNDAWFGRSSGPYQHFHMARARAVEQGVPLVRVANTGITAVADGFGRVIARMGLGEKGFLDTALPVPNQDKTVYSVWGEWLILWLTFLALILRISQHRRKNN